MPPERHLATTLNVSRTVLREALSRLLGEGVLERRSPRILQVASYDPEALAASVLSLDERATSFIDMMELRYILEVGALPLLAARISETSLDEIEQWAQEYEARMRRGETAPDMDVRFHTGLLRAIGNPTIDAMLPLVEEQIRSYLLFDPTQLRAAPRPTTDRVVVEHREIIAALRTRDAAAARNAMERHLAPYFARLQREAARD